ncbi:adipokinetic hormone/corazonin-related peptide receptor variant I-like [Oratosquilla oratoria]|uniref:adipokinetic hormone/corazonin-related peptide receptor variant I-like n=1 Tax=Oratosquilla oratoria TaxID=337810 RepID=UPI003F759F78
MSNIEKARTRTLRMTFIIVLAFIWCWTPYSVVTLWNYIDSTTLLKLNPDLQEIPFIIAVSNSVLHPFIYGRYSITCRVGPCKMCCRPLRRGPPQNSCKSNATLNGSAATRSTAMFLNQAGGSGRTRAGGGPLHIQASLDDSKYYDESGRGVEKRQAEAVYSH